LEWIRSGSGSSFFASPDLHYFFSWQLPTRFFDWSLLRNPPLFSSTKFESLEQFPERIYRFIPLLSRIILGVMMVQVFLHCEYRPALWGHALIHQAFSDRFSNCDSLIIL
jgi:hypothetical protein